MDNCILQSKGLGLNFWVEEINYENYIVNHIPAKVLRNITPEEAWSSIKPDVSHFCLFGSEVWAHTPDEKHKALEPKSEKCIFAGYCEDVKGYRLLQPKSKNIIIRRDVKFDENISAREPSSKGVPPLACKPDSAYVPPLSLSLPFLISFLLVQMMTARMTILLHLLKLFLLLRRFQDGSTLLGMQQVLLQVTLSIDDVHIPSLKELLPHWLEFQKNLIQKPLKKPPIIQIGMKI